MTIERIVTELTKARNQVEKYMLESPESQRRWKAERNWDYWAQKKREYESND